MVDAFWLLFIVASLALIALPGQDMILVMSRSIAQGGRAGVILRISEWLFLALEFVGAACLLYLGIGLLRAKQARLALERR